MPWCNAVALHPETPPLFFSYTAICVCPRPSGPGFGLVNSMVGLLKQTDKNQTLNAMFGLVSIDMLNQTGRLDW
jgi:hypothetical protein